MASISYRVFLGVVLLSFGTASLVLAADDPPIIPRSDWKAPAPILKREPPIHEVTEGRKQIIAENELKERDMNQLEFLTVHSTGIPRASVSDVSGKMKSLRTMVEKGYQVTPTLFSYMAEIPYHYVILRDGEVDGKVAEGRELKFPAATNTRNSDYGQSIAKHLTVVLELKYTKVKGKNGRKDELVELPPTAAQLKSLAELLERLVNKHKISAEKIGYHKQYAETSCPGPAIIAATERIRAALIKKGL